jgi:hypothetical protein
MPAAAVADEFALLVECLTPITDPRFARGKVHPLPGVLALVVLGLMAGGRSLSAISRYGRLHPEILPPLGLRRAPSVATLHRLLQRVRVAEVRAALRTFARRVAQRRHGAGGLAVAAVDGKALRGTREDGEPLHVLQVFAHRGGLALDQAAAAPLAGEVEAARRWVEGVAAAFPGLRVLTGDALFAEADLCRAVVASGRDYLIRLKKTNRPC